MRNLVSFAADHREKNRRKIALLVDLIIVTSFNGQAGIKNAAGTYLV